MAGPNRYLLFICFAAASPALALAQTSPFAGTWAGTVTETSFQETCTLPSTGTTIRTCTGGAPWFGAVDSQGNITVSVGTVTETCNGVTSSYPAKNPSEQVGQVPANGILVQPASTTNASDASGTYSESCAASTVQFSLSTLTVSSISTCTSSSTFTSGGQCSSTQTLDYEGTRISSASSAPPVFPIAVTSNITPTTANATAQIQPPSQAVGTVGSVYVFAHARQSALGSHGAKREPAAGRRGPFRTLDGPVPDPCVLAQLDSNGQLVGASASSLQAYTTGVLSSQSQSVAILNNVPTPNVAGASFLVGYGTTSSAMLASGVYEGAVSVQGSSPCSAALLTGAAPTAPGNLTGLWWNPNESGWGIHFTQRGSNIFAAWYTYDAGGNPKWYTASNCAGVAAGATSGTCTGAVYEVNGPRFFGVNFTPITGSQVSSAGNVQVAFSDANNATMSFTVAGVTRAVAITRQIFPVNLTAPPAVDYTDLWWNPSEAGWGMAITQQYANIFLAWYVYDAGGKPFWYVASNCVVSGSYCSGTLYRTTGPVFATTFDPHAIQVFSVGSAIVTFTDANNAVLTYTVDGASATKTITRQVF